MGTHGPRIDLRGNKQPLVLMMFGQICGSICPMPRKRKQNKDGQSRNQSSTMPDHLEEYSLLNQTMKNSRSQSKPLVESWMFRCQQQCLAKYLKNSGRKHRNIGKRRTRFLCVVDADGSTRPRLEGAGHKPHQDHVTAKGMNSMIRYSLVRKFIPMPQALKKPDAKAVVEKEWEKN